MESGDRYGTGKSVGDGQGEVVVKRMVSLLKDYIASLPSIAATAPVKTVGTGEKHNGTEHDKEEEEEKAGVGSPEVKAATVWDLIKAVSNMFLEVRPFFSSFLLLFSSPAPFLLIYLPPPTPPVSLENSVGSSHRCGLITTSDTFPPGFYLR